MELKKLLIIVIGIMITLAACKKEESDPTNESESEPSATQLQNFFDDNIAAATQKFTIDATSPGEIQGSQGTFIFFMSNSFEDNMGNIVTGNVDIELIEIYDKRGMLFLNKQTLGDENGNLSPLISGGEFNIKAFQNGSEVFFRNGAYYSTIIKALDGPNPNMEVFYQNSETDDTLTWTVTTDSLTTVITDSFDYMAYFGEIGWINLDYFMDFPGDQTTVSVIPPEGFNNTNCSVFISFDGYNSLTSIYNYSNGKFITGSNYTIPVGLDVHFIVLAFINNVPHVAIVPSTITANHEEVISALSATTISQLTTDIQNLP